METGVLEKLDTAALVKHEAWRFARVSRVCTEGLTVPAPAPTEIVEKCIEESRRRSFGASGLLVFVDDALVYSELSEEALSGGVRFEAENAASNFSPTADLGMAIFAEQHRACARSGASLNVPAGLALAEPFAVFRWQVAGGTALFPFTRVRVGDNASVKFCEFHASVADSACSQMILRTDIEIGNGAEFARDFVQALNAEARILRMENVRAGENASLRGVDFNLGAAYARTTTELCANGRGASLEWRALNVASGSQEVDWRTIQRHTAPGASSFLLCKNALLERARTIFSGNILVEKEAQQTSSAQSCRNLVLSEEAEAHSLPGLEIDANDVRCSHGATTGTLDPDQIFYLLQRGLPESDARMLLTLGFMDEVINACAGCSVADFVREKIAEKFGI